MQAFKFKRRKKKGLKITQSFVDCLIVNFHISKLKFSRFQEYEKASNHNLLTYFKFELKKKDRKTEEEKKKEGKRKEREKKEKNEKNTIIL